MTIHNESVKANYRHKKSSKGKVYFCTLLFFIFPNQCKWHVGIVSVYFNFNHSMDIDMEAAAVLKHNIVHCSTMKFFQLKIVDPTEKSWYLSDEILLSVNTVIIYNIIWANVQDMYSAVSLCLLNQPLSFSPFLYPSLGIMMG